MPAWRIKQLWDADAIKDYANFVGVEGPKYVGKLRSTCQDLALRLTIYYAAVNGLPMQISNGANPHGIRPIGFDDLDTYVSKVLTSTGASDLLNYKLVKMREGAALSQPESLGMAKTGDLIILYRGGGHVQLVLSGSPTEVEIIQGNFRPEKERCGWVERKRYGQNQNKPASRCYIGAMVAEKVYVKRGTKWLFEGRSEEFKEDGRLVVWDFMKWNELVIEHVVQRGESLRSIAKKHFGSEDGWQRIYLYNKEVIGDTPSRIHAGQKLFIWT